VLGLLKAAPFAPSVIFRVIRISAINAVRWPPQERQPMNKRTMLSRASCFSIGNILDLALAKFPNTVRIETTNACNSKCVICAHSKMQRPISSMSDDLYKRLIDECAQYNCETVHLHNFGEPLMDKGLVRRVEYAKKKGLKRVKIFSNGSLLTVDKASQLIDAGLDEIKISFDGATKQEFERIRFPLSYDKVVANVKELVRIRDRKASSLKVKIACCSTSDKDTTMQSLENCVDGFSFGKVHNWADSDIKHTVKSTIRIPCSRLWRTFTVLSNGNAVLCCLDYEGKVVLGDANKASIFEIWHSESYKRVRLLHKMARQDEIKICANCTKSFW
jgi:hypothetical protein